jgi:ketosteroid isomerase-like protein
VQATPATDGGDNLSMEHPDAAAYLRTADAFRAKNNELLAELIAEDVVWHVPGSSPLAGDIHGREALFQWFGRLLEVTDNTFSLEEHDVLASDEHVVALSIIGATRDGVPLRQNVVSVFHFRNGRQVERWFYPSDLAAWDQMFGS